jgi:hypothetical protein
VSFGPFLDRSDGVTLEVGLVTAIDHATTGILLSKNGGALTIRSQAVTASTYDVYGNYIVTLSATDTNTIGTLRMQFSEAATCLPVWQDFEVVDELVYDVLFGTVALATTTNITAGTITTTTNLTNLPAITANWLTAAGIAAAALNGKGDWNIGKTGYALSTAGVQAIWDALTSALTTVGSIGKKLADWTVGTIDTYTGNTKQTGDVFPLASTEIADIKAKTDLIPAAPAAVGDIPTANAIADQVWDEAIAGHLGAGSTGLALNSAGAAGDPWSTALPGAYGAGTAGKIVGDNVNATISSRASQTSVDDLPTNAELATSQAAADDATLAAIAALTIPTAIENADALLNRDMATGTDSGSTTVRTVRQALRFLRNKWSISGTTLTVTKENDVDASWTATLGTTAGVDPVTSSDPAGP